MLGVSWTERRVNENILQEISETEKILNIIKKKKWNIIGHVLRHEKELLYIIIEWKINFVTVSKNLFRTIFFLTIL